VLDREWGCIPQFFFPPRLLTRRLFVPPPDFSHKAQAAAAVHVPPGEVFRTKPPSTIYPSVDVRQPVHCRHPSGCPPSTRRRTDLFTVYETSCNIFPLHSKLALIRTPFQVYDLSPWLLTYAKLSFFLPQQFFRPLHIYPCFLRSMNFRASLLSRFNVSVTVCWRNFHYCERLLCSGAFYCIG